MPDVAKQARDEFEVLPVEYYRGTSKLYSRVDLLPLDDPRALSNEDFVRRLRALFGPVKGNEYVVRHRPTGFIVTAYTAQSGPSYGGGPRYPAKLPELGSMPSHAEILQAARERAERIQADPVLSKGSAVNWDEQDLSTSSPDQVRDLREREHAWKRRFADVAAPPGFDKVVARLNELLELAPA